jgi:hypothetical protein
MMLPCMHACMDGDALTAEHVLDGVRDGREGEGALDAAGACGGGRTE